MKKSWKQWMAIVCALSMIACMLPVTAFVEKEVATPTDLAPLTEPVQEAEPVEEPAEEQVEERVRVVRDEPGEVREEV